MLTRLNILLLLAVMASAMLLVKTAYETRRLFDAIHRAETDGERLGGERTRLEAERQLQATNLRVERTAREKLKMSTATPAVAPPHRGAPPGATITSTLRATSSAARAGNRLYCPSAHRYSIATLRPWT